MNAWRKNKISIIMIVVIATQNYIRFLFDFYWFVNFSHAVYRTSVVYVILLLCGKENV